MKTEWKIAIGFILDLIIGDPAFFPHPVRAIGLFINALESPLRKLKKEKTAGVLLVIITVTSTYFLVFFLSSLSVFIEIFLIYTVFAVNSLGKEAWKIYKLLKNKDPEGARTRLSYLVSRETAHLDEQGIIRATVETVSENITDAIIAPLFFLLIGGIPLAYAYKAVNTLDSMVGYKNEKYLRFGRAAAKLDDLVNFLPARLAGFVLIPLAALFGGFDVRNCLRIVKRDRLKHASPNSGHTEAAAAGALNIQLGGTSIYFGKPVEKPLIGDYTRELRLTDITESIKIMVISAFAGLIPGLVLHMIL